MTADTATIEKALRAAIFETFEKMFYIFLEPAEAPFGRCDLETAVRFQGALNGQLTLCFSDGLARTMVQNMLNCGQDEVTEGALEDCAKEAANVIGGRFLTTFENRKAFDLSIPVFRRGIAESGDPVAGDAQACRFHFDAEGESLRVGITVSENQ